jgi:acetolactate synthase-1/2/3 large subunit
MMNYINLKINCIMFYHEQGATHAAQGFARATGKVGAIATSGPGATNLVTGIADAQIDSTPMVYYRDRLENIC